MPRPVRAILARMGLRRPRTLLVGLVGVVAALGSQHAVGSTLADTRVVHGGVSATGQASGSVDWHVEHPDTGIYRITLPGGDVDLDVPEWDQAADVTILPLGKGTIEVRFRQGRHRVDSDFTFVALLGD